MTAPAQRCWSFGPDMRRCEFEGGHQADHQITTTWADEESLTFEGMSAVVEATPIHTSTLIDTAYPAAGDVPQAKCFTCGCTQAQHDSGYSEGGEAMCAKHQCRVFIA